MKLLHPLALGKPKISRADHGMSSLVRNPRSAGTTELFVTIGPDWVEVYAACLACVGSRFGCTVSGEVVDNKARFGLAMCCG